MSYKVKVTKKVIKKKQKPVLEPYYECPCCGYQDDIGGLCPNCEYSGRYTTNMEFCIPEEFLAERLFPTIQ